MFSCVWLHLKKNFGKYFLIFGCILENTIENTFFTCCSHFLTFSQLPNKHIMSFIPKNSNKTQKDSIFSRWDRDRDRRDLDRRDLDRRELADLNREIAIAIAIDASRQIGEIAIAISPISMIAIDADRCDRDRANRRSRDRDRRDRKIAIGAIAIVIDVDRRSSDDRRDRDRSASVWIVPFGSVCGSEQWRFYRGSACVRDSCVWERGGKALKWK